MVFSWNRKRRVSRVVIRRLRRESEERLANLALPAVFGIDDLCRRVSRERGRPLHLLRVSLGASHPCGMWVAAAVEDFIVFEDHTTRTHREHIIAHELAHMICCHRGVASLDGHAARLLFPDLDPELLRDILGRCGYSDHQEQEAEVMASLILERMSPEPGERTWNIPEGAADVVRRIESSIGPGQQMKE